MTVLEAPLTTPTTTTTSSNTSPIPAGVDPLMTLVLGAGMGGVAALVFVLIVLRKKS